MESTVSLNPEQRRAVEHSGGPLLVLAGAGSGKTRVLAARVAWLIAQGAPADSLVAFTFTNRAAREMRERIERSVGESARGLWIGTFHATAARMLRLEAVAAGIPRAFSIIDREDQEDVLGEVLERMGLAEREFRLGAVLGRISDAKNQLLDPEAFAAQAAGAFDRRIAEVYAAYQAELARSGSLDFDDLIAGAVLLMDRRADVAERYRRRFRHVLVDEYQDTNHAQFRFVASLAAGHGNLFVVGDDDQSIYGWRGATVANVLEFEEAFPGSDIVRLEQNYRSTGRILEAANAVIARNRARKGKTLWSSRPEGVPLTFHLATDEVDEARRVRSALGQHVREGGRLGDCAVLYRTNAQSRALETELRMAGISYDVVGGVSFFQRREVKDVLAYLRLTANPRDAVAFWRAWNTPRRGLGPAVEARVTAAAAASGRTPLEALTGLFEAGELSGVAEAGARGLVALLAELRDLAEGPPDRVMLTLLERTRYLEHLGEGPEAADRRANVQELLAAAARAGASGGTLIDFLGEAALVSEADGIEEDTDRALLLTAHNAKGLEFPIVIVTGLEEGLFPHANALSDPAELEEERRLFYVALTRARDRVILTAAAYRRRFDGMGGGAVSRFVDEIPPGLLERDEGPRSSGSPWGARATRTPWRRRERAGTRVAAVEEAPQSMVWATPPEARRTVGREVYHEAFGRGVVMWAEGAGADIKFTVRFGVGVKKVLGRFLVGGFDDAGS